VELENTPQKAAYLVALRHPLTCFLASLRFLTIFPISWRCEHDGKYFQGGLFYFPIIGFILGLLNIILYSLIGSFFQQGVLAVIMVLVLGAVSGFLHYDGLADTFDGFFSSRPKERVLEIMRDSRIGAMGVVAIFAIMALKVMALAFLQSDAMVIVLLLMPLAGRVAIVVSMAILPYARMENGLGSLFYSSTCKLAAMFTFFCLVITSLYFDMKVAAVIIFSFLALVSAYSLWCRRVIGGATGDTLGGICEISEAGVAVAISCLYC
jgi:adenosylcobinamide-GDP ribazoletransferase